VKRIIYEWRLIVAVAMAVAITTLWATSLFSTSTLFHLHVWPLPEASLHLIVGQGDLWLCNDIDDDPSGEIRSLALAPPIASDYRRGDRLRGLAVPGLAFQSYWLAPWRNSIWSLKVSLLIPALLLFLTAALFYRRLKRVRQVAPHVPLPPTRVHVLDRP